MPALDLIRTRFESLSLRQRETCLLLSRGHTNLEIALRMKVTAHTVKAHRAEVMRRMKVETFAELVRQLQQLKVDETWRNFGINPLHLIVVDDDDWYRDYLTSNLQANGYTVTGVTDGEEFDKAWAAQAADIALLDLDLGPGKETGLSIATRLLASTTCGVIMVTANEAQETRLKGLAIGVDAYFSKPAHIEELTLTIANLGSRLR